MSIEKKSEQQPFSSSVTTTAKLPVWPAVGGATRCLNYNGSNLACALYSSNLKYQTLVQSFLLLLLLLSEGYLSCTLELLSVGANFLLYTMKTFHLSFKNDFFSFQFPKRAIGSARTLCRWNIWSESFPNLVQVVLLCWWSSYIYLYLCYSPQPMYEPSGSNWMKDEIK